MNRRMRTFVAVLAAALLLFTGCVPAARPVTISPDATPVPGGLNVVQAQQSLNSGGAVKPSDAPDGEEAPASSPEETEPEGTAPENKENPNAVFPAPDPNAEKIAYLTFDDGPSKHTEEILQVLREKQAPATFFILGVNADSHPERVQAIAADGHLVANHSYSHETKTIYASYDALMADIEKCASSIRSILGDDYPTDLFRFPTGSTNKRCRDYRDQVRAAGYRFFDWNALNGDAETGTYKRTPEELMDRLKETVEAVDGRKKEVIILMHDTGSKENTVKMLGDAIDYMRSLGYDLRTMENAQMP